MRYLSARNFLKEVSLFVFVFYWLGIMNSAKIQSVECWNLGSAFRNFPATWCFVMLGESVCYVVAMCGKYYVWIGKKHRLVKLGQASGVISQASFFSDPFTTLICAYILILLGFCSCALAFLQKFAQNSHAVLKIWSRGLFSSIRTCWKQVLRSSASPLCKNFDYRESPLILKTTQKLSTTIDGLS